MVFDIECYQGKPFLLQLGIMTDVNCIVLTYPI